MFFKERTWQEGILATSRKKIKQAGRLLMALAVGGCLWGQGEVGCAGTYYRFTNPSSGNIGTFSENGYSGNYTPFTYNNETNDAVYIWSYNGGGSLDNNITINDGNYDFIAISSANMNSNSGTSSSNDGDVKNNTITINGGSVQTVIIGAAQNYNATTTGTTTTGIVTEVNNGNGNVITINDGNVGYANANTININGGSITGFSDFGFTTDATGCIVVSPSADTASPGEVNIYNSPNLSGALISASDIAGIYASGSNYSTITADNNSVLNIHTKNLTAKNIYGFKNINFYLPSDIQNGDTVLTLTGYNYNYNGTNYGMLTTDLSGTNIRAGVEGNANLSTGDTITLIKNANGITTDSTTTYGTLSEGVSLDYELTVEKADDTSIVARVGSASSSPEGTSGSGDTGKFSSGGPNTSGGSGTSGTSALKTQTNVLPAPLLASTTLTLHGTDRLLDWLPPEDPVVGDDTSEGKDDSQENVAKAESPNEFQIFANTGFSNLRTKIGGNSYMDNHSAGFDLGAARTLENSRGRLVFAPIVDYGSGSYDVYNDGRHGSGNSKYWAAGMIARQMNKDGFYYEASFRAGRAMVDFASDDFTQGGVPTRVTYDASAPCFAGHVRVGKIYQFGPRNQLHLYGIYSHNHQNGMSAKLSTGETYQFSAVDSGRLRIGGRLSWQKSKTQKFYSGIAYQYEFSNGATGSYKGYSTNSSSIHGSSAMIELGWQIKPSQKSPWMVDVNAAGWVGHQKGFTIQAKLMKSF